MRSLKQARWSRRQLRITYATNVIMRLRCDMGMFRSDAWTEEVSGKVAKCSRPILAINQILSFQPPLGFSKLTEEHWMQRYNKWLGKIGTVQELEPSWRSR